MVFMLYNGKVHLVRIPADCPEPYWYARQILEVPPTKITPWGEVRFENGTAVFDYDLS